MIVTGGDEPVPTEGENIDEGLTASEDFPGFYQSQTQEILSNCDLCGFSCRNKPTFLDHMESHPVCTYCKTRYRNAEELHAHERENHLDNTEQCTTCHKD